MDGVVVEEGGKSVRHGHKKGLPCEIRTEGRRYFAIYMYGASRVRYPTEPGKLSVAKGKPPLMSFMEVSLEPC
jgi:hypothetical protein